MTKDSRKKAMGTSLPTLLALEIGASKCQLALGHPDGKILLRHRMAVDRSAGGAGIRAQIERFVSADALLVNNRDWFASISYLDFLRDVGKHITVNYMLGKESVRARLEDREQGISYTEFSYMLLQAYDFAHLARTHACKLQIGGADQYGNITCGVELHRKMGGKEPIYGLVSPLLLTAAGTKFGKSEKGQNVWLDPAVTSPYQFYQFWLNADDADVAKYLKMFTFLPLIEIDAILAEHDVDRAKRVAQKRLASEVTIWVHGADAERRARAVTGVLFGGDVKGLTDADLQPILADAPAIDVPRAELDAGLAILDLLGRVGLAESKSEGRRLVTQGGLYLNNVRVDDPNRTVGPYDLATETMILLRGGKKKFRIIRVVKP